VCIIGSERWRQSGCLLVDAGVNGYDVVVLVDTGAAVSIVDNNFCLKLAITLMDYNGSDLVSASRQRLSTNGIASLSVTIANSSFDAEFVVVPDFPYTLLIGNDILRKHRAVIDYGVRSVVICSPRIYEQNILSVSLERNVGDSDGAIRREKIAKMSFGDSTLTSDEQEQLRSLLLENYSVVAINDLATSD